MVRGLWLANGCKTTHQARVKPETETSEPLPDGGMDESLLQGGGRQQAWLLHQGPHPARCHTGPGTSGSLHRVPALLPDPSPLGPASEGQASLSHPTPGSTSTPQLMISGILVTSLHSHSFNTETEHSSVTPTPGPKGGL